MKVTLEHMKSKKWGSWTVLGYLGTKDRFGAKYLLCMCDCGAEVEVIQSSLRFGRSTQCTSCSTGKVRDIDFVGEEFGHLTVMRRSDGINGQCRWVCRCVCGSERPYNQSSLRAGRSKGCTECNIGKKEAGELRKKDETVEGHKLYPTWSGMRQRCTNPNATSYNRYGGRGISVCDRWNESFWSFVEDMGDRPSDLHSLDRIDNNGNYVMENCKWSTRREQSSNTVSNRKKVLHEGSEITLAELSRRSGISHATLTDRQDRGVCLFTPTGWTK